MATVDIEKEIVQISKQARAINSFLWFITLLTTSFWVGAFCSFWLVILKPVAMFIPELTMIVEMLANGADFPYICVLKMKKGDIFFDLSNSNCEKKEEDRESETEDEEEERPVPLIVENAPIPELRIQRN